MKSSIEGLRRRGYIEDMDIEKYSLLKKEEILKMIDSKEAYERTIAIRILANSNNIERLVFNKALLSRLMKEKSLYTKIEICNVLEKGDQETLIEMFKYLGKIGNNQYRELPKEVSKKKSYPLPRDIIARTIAKMNSYLLPSIYEEFKQCNLIEARELIDAIGYLCFYNKDQNNLVITEELIDYYEKTDIDNIIRWKIVIALSAFNSEIVVSKLKQIIVNESVDIIRKEAERSLKLINIKSLNGQ